MSLGLGGNRFVLTEPKKASGPFHFFLEDFRSEVKKSKTVVIEPKDMVKKCTEQWHKMKERDKMKYKIMSMADHKREKYERKVFNSRCKKEKVEVNKPKGCRPAVNWFIQDQAPKVKEENPNLKWAEHFKILNQRYKDLSEEERRPYLEMEEKDRQRYKDEVKEKKEKERKLRSKPKPKKGRKKSVTSIDHNRITSNEYVSSDSDSD